MSLRCIRTILLTLAAKTPQHFIDKKENQDGEGPSRYVKACLLKAVTQGRMSRTAINRLKETAPRAIHN